MANYKNTNVAAITTSTVVPTPTIADGTTTAPSGTITIAASSKDVTGTSTKFLSELVVGAWIADTTHSEVRKVVAIKTDTACTIDRAFSNALSTATPVYIQPSRIVRMSLYCATGAKVDNVAIPAAQIVVFDKASREAQHSPIDYVDPVLVDGTSGTITAWYET